MEWLIPDNQRISVHQPLNREYYCSTCQMPFASNDEYKAHYKSDHHRYNIKRKMVKLPPVTLQQFSTKLLEAKNEQEQKLQCNECRKTFASLNTLNQHVQSKNHNPHAIIQARPKVAKAPAVFEKNHKKCLFCEKVSRDLQENEEHMQNAHSFFIAQREFCKKPEGLIEYLQEKIEVGNMCITCENKKAKDFQSADAVRKHMVDRGHSIMKTEEGFEEYEKYYDFTRLFEEKLKEQERPVPGIEYQKVKVLVDDQEAKGKEDGSDEEWEDEENSDEDEEWESDGEEGNEQGEEIKEETKKPRVKVYQIMRPTLTSNDELLLPNGKLLGHRKYRHIYKQTLRLPNWFATQFKAITAGDSPVSNAIVMRRNLIELIKKQDKIVRNRIDEKKNALRVGLTNNGLQHYFRIQNSM